MALSTAERDRQELIRRGSVLLTGGYVWAATVLHPVAQRGAPVAARAGAAIALLALLGGSMLAAPRARLGRIIALHGFVGACVVTWILCGTRLSIERLDPVRGALGALGWVLFALGWGVPREPSRVPEDDPGVLVGEPLSPRDALPRGSAAVLALGIGAAALPLAAAWQISRPQHALFGQAIAIGLALSLINTGSELAAGRRRWAPVEPVRRRVASAALPLTMLGLALVAGLVGFLSR